MKIRVQYFIRRKDDGELMEIRFVDLLESDILDLAAASFTMPIHLSDKKYEYSGSSINEVTELS